MLKKSKFTALLITIVCAIGFILIAFLVGENKFHRFDNRVISLIQGIEAPILTTFMTFFTDLGSMKSIVWIMILVMTILYKFLGHRKELIFLAVVVIGSSQLNWILKIIFQRARPTFHRIIEANGYSFPSGHSMAAFSMYGALAFLVWKHVPTVIGRVITILLSALFIVVIGISRIYLGVHYPSDVIGGYLISACWLTSSIWFYQRYVERNAVEKPRHA